MMLFAWMHNFRICFAGSPTTCTGFQSYSVNSLHFHIADVEGRVSPSACQVYESDLLHHGTVQKVQDEDVHYESCGPLQVSLIILLLCSQFVLCHIVKCF